MSVLEREVEGESQEAAQGYDSVETDDDAASYVDDIAARESQIAEFLAHRRSHLQAYVGHACSLALPNRSF